VQRCAGSATMSLTNWCAALWQRMAEFRDQAAGPVYVFRHGRVRSVLRRACARRRGVGLRCEGIDLIRAHRHEYRRRRCRDRQSAQDINNMAAHRART
jgi:hypothetical protein